jgi:hypothetical protein
MKAEVARVGPSAKPNGSFQAYGVEMENLRVLRNLRTTLRFKSLLRHDIESRNEIGAVLQW